MRILAIKNVKNTASEWPTLPRVEELTIEIHGDRMKSIPSVLRASSAPALRRLTISYDEYHFPWRNPVCPLLEGAFEHLRSIDVRGLAIDAGMFKVSIMGQLTTLSLYSCHISWSDLSRALQECACPSLEELCLENYRQVYRGSYAALALRRLDLSSSGIRAFPDGLGALRSLRALDISGTSIAKIQSALYDYIRQLSEFHSDGNLLEGMDANSALSIEMQPELDW